MKKVTNVTNRMKKLELENSKNIDAKHLSLNQVGNMENKFLSVFNKRCSSSAEAIVDSSKYILHMDGTRDTNFNVAVGKSDSDIVIYNISNDCIAKLDTLLSTNSNCTGVRFVKDDKNLIYSSYINGKINLWDLRSVNKPVSEFTDTTDESGEKQFLCCDISCNNRLLAAGTDLSKDSSYVLFWDVRNAKLLGGYWESHTDDVTQVKFHPEDINKMISASTDGLINVYDLNENEESDALIDTFNTNSSVEHIKWFKHQNKDFVYSSTHTFDVQLWRVEDAEMFANFDRAFLGKKVSFCEKNSEELEKSYVAGGHNFADGEFFFMVGTSDVDEVQTLNGFSLNKNALKQSYFFQNNSQRVRSSYFNQNASVLVTGGEKGILNVWKMEKPS